LTPKAIRILLADDHAMFVQAIRVLLDSQPDMKVVATASHGRDAMRLIIEDPPDVVVMDVAMPELNGLEATRHILASELSVRVLCLSGQTHERTVIEAMRAGALGFVLKTSPVEELLQAIRTVGQGELYLSPSVASVVISSLGRPPGHEGVSPISVLSPREREVLQLMAEGRSTKGVASLLHVSVKTAESHRRNLMQKLHIDNVADLTKLAVREGLTSL
jgi:DNA-binding NarL/FixJ family response regulator